MSRGSVSITRVAAFGHDNDGDINVLVLNMNNLRSLLRNDGGNKQNWIKFKLMEPNAIAPTWEQVGG
jgi:hypothetical protein